MKSLPESKNKRENWNENYDELLLIDFLLIFIVPTLARKSSYRNSIHRTM